MCKFILQTIFHLLICSVLCGQVCDVRINFSHIGRDTIDGRLHFVSINPKGEKLYCGLLKEYSYFDTVAVSWYGDMEYKLFGQVNKLVNFNISCPKNPDKIFNGILSKLKTDTFLFSTRLTLKPLEKNNFLLSSFNKYDKNHEWSEVIRFSKILIDDKYPILAGFCKEGYDVIIAFLDEKGQFHLINHEGEEGFVDNNIDVYNKKINPDKFNEIKSNLDTIRFKYFNAKSLTMLYTENDIEGLSYDPYAQPEFGANYFKIMEISEENKDAIYKISSIKKYRKGAFLKSVKSKSFNNNLIKFFDGKGTALITDSIYNITNVTIFKEIHFPENITILYSDRCIIIPFENHYKVIFTQGKIIKTLMRDFQITKTVAESESNNIFVFTSNNFYGIKNKNNYTLLPAEFDTIILNNKFSFTHFTVKKSKEVKVFNNVFQEIYSSKNIKDFNLTETSIQLIDGKDMFWLSRTGEKYNNITNRSDLKNNRIMDCDFGAFMNDSYYYQIDSQNIFSFFHRANFSAYSFEEIDEYSSLDTFAKLGNIKIISDSILYVNGKNKFVSYNAYLSFFGEACSSYLLSFLKGRVSLIKLNLSQSNYEELLKADEVKNLDELQPIQFRIGNVWGYYPLMIEPKYLSVSSFNGHYARIQNANGKWGWINRDGKEFWD
jgi:hypothetical protein